MRKEEIVGAIMSTFPNVQDVEVGSAMGPMITIVVTTDLVNSAEQYDLRVRIGELLEPMRAAGTGFNILLKRFDDRSMIVFNTASASVAETFAGIDRSARDVKFYNSADELMKDFPATVAAAAGISSGYFEDGVIITVATTRNRFDAVAQELVEEVPPLMKPSTPAPVRVVPQLFQDVITFTNGKPSACPKCGCFAFERNVAGDQALCRGCPLPAPIFATELADNVAVEMRRFKCGRCNKRTSVTMEMKEINLYCGGCGGLTLHEMEWQTKPAPAEWKNETLGVSVPPDESPPKTRVLRGKNAVFTFKNISFQGIPVSDTEVVEVGATDFDAFSSPDPETKYPPGKGYSIKLTAESTTAWIDVMKLMQPGRPRTKYEPTEEELTASPAAGLAEMFRKKLGLRPFREWEEYARKRKRDRDMRQVDWIRGTGRTTQALLFAIAEYATTPNLRLFCTVGSSMRYSTDLANEAKRLYEGLNLSVQMPIRPLSPDDFDQRYNYGQERVHVYIDHSYRERR